jgi:hypothetical protein
VTELLLSATETAPQVDLAASPCAERFLARTVEHVRPEVIVAVGVAVDGYLRGRTPHATGLAFHTRAVGAGSGDSCCSPTSRTTAAARRYRRCARRRATRRKR